MQNKLLVKARRDANFLLVVGITSSCEVLVHAYVKNSVAVDNQCKTNCWLFVIKCIISFAICR